MSALPQPPTSDFESSPVPALSPAGASGPSSGDAGAEPVLSAEHYAQLAAVQLAFTPIRRALRVVTFSASTLALFAVLSLPFAFFGVKAAFVAVGLVVATVFEFRGRAALARLDVGGVKILVWNQIALTGVLAIYCLWSMAAAWFGPDLYAEMAAQQPEVGEMLAPYSDLFRQAAVVFYGIVLVAGVLIQALVIRYYASRRRHVEQYLAETPAWILAWNRP